MKECKLTHAHARTRAHTHTHARTEIDFSLQFVLTDYADFIYVPNVKGIINNIEPCSDTCFHKTETINNFQKTIILILKCTGICCTAPYDFS